MVAVETQVGFRDRSEREIVSDMWTGFFRLRRPELTDEDMAVLVDRVVDVVINGPDDFKTQKQEIAGVYLWFDSQYLNGRRLSAPEEN